MSVCPATPGAAALTGAPRRIKATSTNASGCLFLYVHRERRGARADADTNRLAGPDDG